MDDNRVEMELDIDDETFLMVAKRAHALDITFNKMIEKLLTLVIENEEYLREAKRLQEGNSENTDPS